jgi:uncharacterized protein with PIN domain
MRRQDFDGEWAGKSAEVLSGMKEWRLQHPRATLREIEKEMDERLAGLRQRMIENMVEASQAAEWEEAAEGEKPVCPECRKPLQQRGEEERGLYTQGGKTLRLKRRYGVCPQCGAGFFPPG